MAGKKKSTGSVRVKGYTRSDGVHVKGYTKKKATKSKKK